LNAGKLLSGLVLQPQVLSGGLSLGALLASNIIQSQSLSGSLIVGKPLSGSVSQPQTLTGGLLSSAPLTFSSTIATLQGSAGMTQVVSAYADDAGQYLPDIGFNFPIYGSTYRTNISVGSNWYLLFGAVSTAFSGLSRTSPGMGLLFGAADRSWRNVYFNAGSKFCQIRFEAQTTSSGASNTAIFQIKLFNDGTIELTIGIGCFYSSPAAITSLTKGDGITYADFTVPAGSTAQTDFTSTVVLTSLVFRPVDVAGNSHTVATGSYS